MTDSSIFTDKDKAPSEKDLEIALGRKLEWFNELRTFVSAHCGDVTEEWNYSKHGWNYRIKDRKRAVMYVMPCDQFFKVSLVFGAKATEAALSSDIGEDIKETIRAAKVYAEGRGFRVDVKSRKTAGDIKKLLNIKMTH